MTDFSRVGLNLDAIGVPKFDTNIPYFEPKALLPPNMAEYAVNAIYEEIADFESTLDSEHELGMPVVGGPAGLCVHVREVYRYGTDKLVFVGIDSHSKPVRLIQHLSQLNLLMLAAPKLGETAARIGFHGPEE